MRYAVYDTVYLRFVGDVTDSLDDATAFAEAQTTATGRAHEVRVVDGDDSSGGGGSATPIGVPQNFANGGNELTGEASISVWKALPFLEEGDSDAPYDNPRTDLFELDGEVLTVLESGIYLLSLVPDVFVHAAPGADLVTTAGTFKWRFTVNDDSHGPAWNIHSVLVVPPLPHGFVQHMGIPLTVVQPLAAGDTLGLEVTTTGLVKAEWTNLNVTGEGQIQYLGAWDPEA